MTTAVPTSLFIIALNSLVGFSGDLFSSVPVDWKFLLSAFLIASLGLFGGVRLSKLFTPTFLKAGFGWFILLMGAWIFLKQLDFTL